ncbi:NAD(P)H-dependent glycerol-3-phosphate dehydrogenase [Olegusella massiliensis]|uniref:NAD(P)H-dependent glycerol-3-phosphate dehydrogenase n=1 Tax=Olegusella massiliensis TaxID=1776381 RepID=UPI0008381E29|nr:NAD(P)H-dependent glycerol-3-phosphate dehydrogenase [Olegusella massiliensis]
MSKVSVIGTGSWGTAAAGLLAVNADEVTLLARSAEVADAINTNHHNPRHLCDYVLPANVCATLDCQSIADVDAVVIAVPSSFLRDTTRQIAAYIAKDMPICVLTKGIEQGSCMLMADVVEEELGGKAKVAALSGPNHAEEICRGKVSAAVVASEDPQISALFQTLFMSPSFRAYASTDIKGVELCAAIKNVIAIACGVAVGLGAGDNTLAVLMTRGLAEIGRISVAAGGDPLTCMGLAGMGDLVATCTSPHSRNRSFGEAFVAGESLSDYESRTHMVVEGARAACSTLELAHQLKVECPITESVHAILYEHADISSAIDSLLGRPPRKEFYGID